jgi:hypothetical protein
VYRQPPQPHLAPRIMKEYSYNYLYSQSGLSCSLLGWHLPLLRKETQPPRGPRCVLFCTTWWLQVRFENRCVCAFFFLLRLTT